MKQQGGGEAGPSLCNPNASTEARALYSLLKRVSGRYTLSGQHNYIHVGSRYTRHLRSLTGQTPLVWGSDFSFMCTGTRFEDHRHCGPLNLTPPDDPPGHLLHSPHEARMAMVDEAISRHKDGHLITLMWHHPVPIYGDAGPGEMLWTLASDRRPDEKTWRELVTPGTSLHERWLAGVDTVAYYLGRLRDARVPVLWRPYHEMNGIWFWWCNRPGPEGIARLYRNMYERLTKVHHLDNLIWVWNANAPRDIPGDEAFSYADSYPGHDVVDVLAADVYNADYRDSHHDQLAELGQGKPIALGEIGHFPEPQVLERQPRWSWFMGWGPYVYSTWNEPSAIQSLYDDSRVIHLENRHLLSA